MPSPVEKPIRLFVFTRTLRTFGYNGGLPAFLNFKSLLYKDLKHGGYSRFGKAFSNSGLLKKPRQGMKKSQAGPTGRGKYRCMEKYTEDNQKILYSRRFNCSPGRRFPGHTVSEERRETN
jgi:hypothetical protein